MGDRTLLETRLDELIAARTIVEIDRDGLASETLVGTVLQHSPHVVILEKLDDNYQADGLAAIRPRSITRVRTGGRESRFRRRHRFWSVDRRALLGFST